MQKHKINIASALAIAVLLVLLVCVRLFQERLFYDPLLDYFKRSRTILPQYDSVKLFIGLLFRYLLNTVLSIGILWFCFKDKSILKLTAVLYVVFFIALAAVFFTALAVDNPANMLLFYIRRFLIQPLLLILFVPAFYYQKHVK